MAGFGIIAGKSKGKERADPHSQLTAIRKEAEDFLADNLNMAAGITAIAANTVIRGLEYFPRKSFWRMVDYLILFSMVISACSPYAPTVDATQTETSGPRVTESATAVITKNPPSREPKVTRSPTDIPSPSDTPSPTDSCLINGTVFAESNRLPSGGYKWPQEVSVITEWTDAEKKNIVDAEGNPIYLGVEAIDESDWAWGMTRVSTSVGKGCGYGSLYRNLNGDLVWATDEQGRVLFRPDGNGQGKGSENIPEPDLEGGPQIVVGKEQTVVWVNQDKITARFDPVQQNWEVFENNLSVERIAKRMGYENCSGCMIEEKIGGKVLENGNGSVLAFTDKEKWITTKGWEKELNLYPKSVEFVSEAMTTSVVGGCGGVVENEIQMLGDNGQVIGTSELAFKLIYQDRAKNLRMLVAPVIIRLPDGRQVVSDQWWDEENDSEAGGTPESIKEYFRIRLETGKQLNFIFYDSADHQKAAESLYQDNPEPGSNYQNLHDLYGRFLKSAGGNVASMLEAGIYPNDLILPIQYSSSLYRIENGEPNLTLVGGN